MLFLATFALAQSTWSPPYTVVDPPQNIARCLNKLKKAEGGFVVDGELLTLIGKGSTNPLRVGDWLSIPMKFDDHLQTWVGQARMNDWNQAFFDYSIREGNGFVKRQFRGPKAPAMPKETDKLKGYFKIFTLSSSNLGEDRQVEVYVPPHTEAMLPVVVMADGDSTEGFAKVSEPLILSKKVAPFAIVGVHHGEYKGATDKYEFEKDFRAREYLKIADPDRFALHLKFVCDEVLPWAREKFHLSSRREDTAVFGYSNGGAFAVTAALDAPEVFGTAMPSSVAVFDPKALAEVADKGKNTRFYFVAGKLEVFINNTQNAVNVVKDKAASCTFDTYVSGHDSHMWKLGFARDIVKVFPPKR